MDWTIIIIIASFTIFVLSSLALDYFNYKQTKIITQKLLDVSNRVDYLERQFTKELFHTDGLIRNLQTNLDGVKDNLKYEYLPNKTAYCMYDMHNARLISLNDSLEGYRNILARLEPLAPLADKFDVKRRMLHNKDYMADLKEELKEIEDELKGIA